VHVPNANAVDDPEVVLRLLRGAAIGHLVSTDGRSGFEATPVPFLVDDDMTTVRAHLARANPHWRELAEAPALLLVPVTDAYVSPSWYPSKADDPRVVPTANYEVVHVHGSVQVHDDPAFVRSVVTDLTTFHEAKRVAVNPAPPPWSVDDAPADFIERQLRAIVGIELRIDRVVAKRKLSQNREERDQAGVIAGLRSGTERRDLDVADAMSADAT
jgi:transcriptional regulator